MIIPGVVCHDTLAIADFLDVPVYGPDPEVTHLYSTKSGARRIFQAAEVDMPPGEFDVYNIQQLIECLAELVTTYPHIHKWLIKLDCQFDNRGTYVLDVARNLPCLPTVRREREKIGENWKHKSFQQTSYLYVLNQLPKVCLNMGLNMGHIRAVGLILDRHFRTDILDVSVFSSQFQDFFLDLSFGRGFYF